MRRFGQTQRSRIMAVLFHKEQSGHIYEVRGAGKTRRLYTDGVFHSQYNPDHVVTGSVWDLLFLPGLFFAPEKPLRVLVLGVGGGAAIHLLNRFCAPASIVGVELSKIHLQVARKYFDLRYPNLQLVQANAIEWLIEYDGEPFDLIIDDLYGEELGEPCRAVTADASWFDILLDHLAEDGIAVLNFVNNREWRDSGYFYADFVREAFPAVFRFTTPTCHNAVVALSRGEIELKDWRRRLREFPQLDTRRPQCRLRFRINRI